MRRLPGPARPERSRVHMGRVILLDRSGTYIRSGRYGGRAGVVYCGTHLHWQAEDGGLESPHLLLLYVRRVTHTTPRASPETRARVPACILTVLVPRACDNRRVADPIHDKAEAEAEVLSI
jgi:hypothetical protein